MKSLSNTLFAAAAAGILSLAASQAHADFSGAYIGAQIGYGKTSADTSGTIGGTSFSGSEDDSGVNYGIMGGYGRQFGSWYVGGELEASLSDNEWSATDSGITGRVEQDWTWGISARVGYVINPKSLVYARAGFVQTNFEASLTDGVTTVSDDETFNGFRFGLGFEYMVSAHIGIRADYTHTNYADKSASSGADNASVDFDEDLFRIGVSYKF